MQELLETHQLTSFMHKVESSDLDAVMPRIVSRGRYNDRMNSMTFWFPILDQIGMRVPETHFVQMPELAIVLLEGIQDEHTERFVDDLTRAMDSIGYPCFLRTESLSCKHDWVDTCYIAEKQTKEQMYSRLYKMLEFSSIVAMPNGLPHSVFAVRKLIPTAPMFHAFNSMPITKEVRVFVEEGHVESGHPYWPTEAFKRENYRNNVFVQLPPDLRDKLIELQTITQSDADEIYLQALYVAGHFRGKWSIDFLQDTKGDWWITDMALAECSYRIEKPGEGDIDYLRILKEKKLEIPEEAFQKPTEQDDAQPSDV